MNFEINTHIEKLVSNILGHRKSNENIFDIFNAKMQDFYDRPIHSFAEMKAKKNTKLKGDIFEHFCLKYLKFSYNLANVWLLKDTPQNILDTLSLQKLDLGIDLIGQDSKGKYYAIQAKYRQRNLYKIKTGISWKDLSTFYALALKSGPFEKHIVITNVDYVRHVGKKTKKDLSICVGSLRKIKYEEWLQIANIQENLLGNLLVVPQKLKEIKEEIETPIIKIREKDELEEIEEKEEKEEKDELEEIEEKEEKTELELLREKRLAFYLKN